MATTDVITIDERCKRAESKPAEINVLLSEALLIGHYLPPELEKELKHIAYKIWEYSVHEAMNK